MLMLPTVLLRSFEVDSSNSVRLMLSSVLLYQGVNTAAYTGGSDSGMSSGSAMAPSSGRHLLQVRDLKSHPLAPVISAISTAH